VYIYIYIYIYISGIQDDISMHAYSVPWLNPTFLFSTLPLPISFQISSNHHSTFRLTSVASTYKRTLWYLLYALPVLCFLRLLTLLPSLSLIIFFASKKYQCDKFLCDSHVYQAARKYDHHWESGVQIRFMLLPCAWC
jgi:hypothetical protein